MLLFLKKRSFGYCCTTVVVASVIIVVTVAVAAAAAVSVSEGIDFLRRRKKIVKRE